LKDGDNYETQAITLLLGLCLAALAVAASPAYARSTTGFSSFHVELLGKASKNAYLCLYENYGAVVNDCGYPVSLEFDLPIDIGGTKAINVQNWWGGTDAEETFSCNFDAFAGFGPTLTAGGEISFVEPCQSVGSAVDVSVGGESIQLICWNIPSGGGIANINWTP